MSLFAPKAEVESAPGKHSSEMCVPPGGLQDAAIRTGLSTLSLHIPIHQKKLSSLFQPGVPSKKHNQRKFKYPQRARPSLSGQEEISHTGR